MSSHKPILEGTMTKNYISTQVVFKNSCKWVFNLSVDIRKVLIYNTCTSW